MLAFLTTLLLASSSAIQPTSMARPSSIAMSSVSKDVKNGVAAISLAAVTTFAPAASFAQAPIDLPTQAVAADGSGFTGGFHPEGYTKPKELGKKPNVLKQAFRGLGLTTGFRMKGK